MNNIPPEFIKQMILEEAEGIIKSGINLTILVENHYKESLSDSDYSRFNSLGIKKTELRVACAGYIVSLADLIDRVGSDNEFFKNKYSHLERGPKIENTFWAKAVSKASNLVRHSSEWNEVQKEFFKLKGENSASEEELLKFIIDKNKEKYNQTVDGIYTLKLAGVFIMYSTLDDLDFFKLSKELRLLDFNFTIECFKEYLAQMWQIRNL